MRLSTRFRKSLLPVALAAGSLGATATNAQAEITWAAPPECKESQWARDGDRLGQYTKADEYTKTIEYGGVRETQYIWVFYVEVPTYPYGMVPGGRAEKLCGADSVSTLA